MNFNKVWPSGKHISDSFLSWSVYVLIDKLLRLLPKLLAQAMPSLSSVAAEVLTRKFRDETEQLQKVAACTPIETAAHGTAMLCRNTRV